MTVDHKLGHGKAITVCGATSKGKKRPLIVQTHWSHVTCKSCLKKRPPNTRNGEFLKVGTKIARLRHELLTIGAYQAMRFLDKSADVFHEDVAYIIKQREEKNGHRRGTLQIIKKQIVEKTSPRRRQMGKGASGKK